MLGSWMFLIPFFLGRIATPGTVRIFVFWITCFFFAGSAKAANNIRSDFHPFDSVNMPEYLALYFFALSLRRTIEFPPTSNGLDNQMSIYDLP